jgi:hypothetical protein
MVSFFIIEMFEKVNDLVKDTTLILSCTVVEDILLFISIFNGYSWRNQNCRKQEDCQRQYNDDAKLEV